MTVIDHQTFEKQIRESIPNLYRLAYGILHNRADAEDAVSETLLRAYEKLHTLRKAERFHAWLTQIAANEARKIYAGNRKHTPMENMEPYMPAFQDDHHELWDVVMELELCYRETILLYFYERLTIPEIAKALRVPQGTVKSRLSRGKKLLREKLSDH
ncbi:MAG: sigma-70 family RNA polymerase sigma factor [Lachnospiraceae bacterium]